MFSNKENDEWEYIPVETADEVMSCGNIVECKFLKNWNRWLKIRKQQHKYLGLMVMFKHVPIYIILRRYIFRFIVVLDHY